MQELTPIKRRSKKAARTRELLLEKAYKLFQSKGFDATTMRDIAREAKMSLGSTYYYFATKEALVLAFYERSLEGFTARGEEVIGKTTDFEKRLALLLASQLISLRPYRSFLHALSRTSLDPHSKLSPFSPGTEKIRLSAINVFKWCMDGSNVRGAENITRRLPMLLWLYHMGIIFYWLHDTSEQQIRTAKMIERTVTLINQILKVSSLPLIGRMVEPVLLLLDEWIMPQRLVVEEKA